MKFFKKLDRKGFTLAEMLIVMAVVVVLAAAAIPSVADEVESARESNDVSATANEFTSAYTEASVYFSANPTETTKSITKSITPTQKTAGWNIGQPKIGDKASTGGTSKVINGSLTFVFGYDGEEVTVTSVTFGEATA